MRIASPVLKSACLAIAAGSLWASVSSARASVAVCERSLSGEAAEDRSELAAKKRALENWVAHASRHGAQFGRWGIAWNRRLECSRSDVGLYRCTATGHPCMIRHVAPADTIPLRRGVAP